jgi:hypothetical protein
MSITGRERQEAYQVPRYNIVSGDFDIMPCDIPSNFTHLWCAFDHCETEISAAYILRFCQEQGSWAPFGYKQINAFYRRTSKFHTFTFNRLIDPGMHYGMHGERRLTGGGWIVQNQAAKLYYVTDDFIRRVHKSVTE